MVQRLGGKVLPGTEARGKAFEVRFRYAFGLAFSLGGFSSWLRRCRLARRPSHRPPRVKRVDQGPQPVVLCPDGH